MASLLITTGPQAGTYYELPERPLSVGRDPSREIQLRDPKVSRKHFLIRREDDGFGVLEHHSKNGLYVNGTRVTAATLKNGDEIRVGDTVLVFYEGALPGRSSALGEYRKASIEFRREQTRSG